MVTSSKILLVCPPRLDDHGIPLKDETIIVKIRLYEYPSVQKDEIERLVREVL